MIQLLMVIMCASLVLAIRQDPLCERKACPKMATCRVVADCTSSDRCTLAAECVTHHNGADVRVCQIGHTILIKKNDAYEDFSCGPSIPCPEGTYCNQDLMDTYSRCCRSDPRNPTKPGKCPELVAGNDICTDACNNDGDCHGPEKCCNIGGCRDCYPAENPA